MVTGLCSSGWAREMLCKIREQLSAYTREVAKGAGRRFPGVRESPTKRRCESRTGAARSARRWTPHARGRGRLYTVFSRTKDAVTHIFFQFPFVRELRIPLAKTSALDFAEAVKTRNEHPFEGCGGEGHTALQTLRRDDLVGSVTHLPKPI